MMKRIILSCFPLMIIVFCVGIFFRQTIASGKLPVPTDTLVGMYHPWLDWAGKEYPSGMPYKNFLITDPVRQQIPWRKLAIDSLRKGNFRPWNPYSFSGAPLLTNIQSGLYYPLNFLFFILPFPLAWTALVILQTFLSGIFFYFFTRRSLRLSTVPSLFGSVCFMFSGFMTVWLTWGTIGQTLLWLPLALFSIDGIVTTVSRKKKMLYGVLLTAAIVSSYFAGHSQIFLYAAAVSAVYAMARICTARNVSGSNKIIIIMFITVIAVTALITSIHWLPLVSDYASIARLQEGSEYTKVGFFIPAQNLIQLFIPDFFGNPATLNYWGIWNYAEFSGYIGIAGLLFAWIAVLTGLTNRRILFWACVVFGAVLFALSNPISRLPYVLHIPFFSSLQPTRLLSIADFALSVLSAYGMDVWMKKGKTKSAFGGLLIIACLFGIIWFIVKTNTFHIEKEYLDVTARNLIFPTMIFVILTVICIIRIIIERIFFISNRGVVTALALLVLGFGVYDQLRFGWKFTPFTDPKLFFPDTQITLFLQKQQIPFRVLPLDDQIMPPNVSTYYGIETSAGYDPMYDSRYETFIAALERGEPNIRAPYGFNRIIAPKNINSPLFALLGVRFVLTLSDLDDARFAKVLQEGQTRMYEYKAAIPRLYLADRVETEKDPKRLFERLYSPSFVPGKDAIIEDVLNVSDKPLTPKDSVHLLVYSNTIIDASIQTAESHLLILGNVYNTGWKAYVDGKECKILPVNYTFMGIVVPEGSHTIKFSYE